MNGSGGGALGLNPTKESVLQAGSVGSMRVFSGLGKKLERLCPLASAGGQMDVQ